MLKGGYMAKITDTESGKRRTIRLSTDDIISIVREYQQLTKGLRYAEDIYDTLSNNIIYIPEE